MGRIFKANARIKHHTLTSDGATFSIPTTEDFTTAATMSTGLLWTANDLAKSEIGVNSSDKRVYIRIDDEIKEFALFPITSTSSGSDDYIRYQTLTAQVGSSASVIAGTISMPYTVSSLQIISLGVPAEGGSQGAYTSKIYSGFYYNGATVSQIGTASTDTKATSLWGGTYIDYNIDGSNVGIRINVASLEEVSDTSWTIKYLIDTKN